MGLLESLVLNTLPVVPRPLMRRLSARYIAGETLREATDRLGALAARGHAGILDILGEDTSSEEEARAAAAAYRAAANAIAENSLDAYVSVKPTHFGLRVSPELAYELYAELLAHCAERDQFVRVEMEDHTTTDATLELFARLRAEFNNVGIVLQSRLFRTRDDIAALPQAPVDVRLVKGIYLEPEEIAHTEYQPIRDAFVECAQQLFQAGHELAIATHDESLAGRVLRGAKDAGVDPGRYCFEVLLGVQEGLWQRWQDAGNRVLVYVPFGPEWRSYSQRRLRKNPEILRHVVRNVFTSR